MKKTVKSANDITGKFTPNPEDKLAKTQALYVDKIVEALKKSGDTKQEIAEIIKQNGKMVLSAIAKINTEIKNEVIVEPDSKVLTLLTEAINNRPKEWVITVTQYGVNGSIQKVKAEGR